MNNNEIKLLEITETSVNQVYLDWLKDPEVTMYTEQRWLQHSLGSIKSYVNAMNISDCDFLYGVYVGRENLVGTCKLGSINWNHGTSQISFLLGNKSFWGRGIGTQIVSLLVKIAFWDLGLKKLTAGVYESNIASRKVFEKNNFVVEGILSSQVSTVSGREAAIIYGLISNYEP